MRVLLTADTLGGVWTYAAELANALAARDVDVLVAAMGRRPDGAQLDAMASTPVTARECLLEWMADPWDDVEAAGDWLLDLHDDYEPDVVHLNGYVHAALPWPVPVVVVAHSDVLSWFESVQRRPAPPEWDRYRLEVERGLCAANVVVAPTAAMLAALERHYAFDAERVVVANGRRVTARAARKEPLVLGAGRAWDEAKNLDALERVARRLPWRVLVVGDGSRTGRVRDADLADAMSRAAIFALPARYEPFGLSALEAAHAGCALVLGDIASLREVWDDAAVFVDPNDDHELREALGTLIADETLRARYAAAARRRASAYTPDAMAAGYLDVYERVRAVEHV